MRFVAAFVLTFGLLAALIIGALLYDPVRQQAELQRQQALTAIEVQSRQLQLQTQAQDAARRADFWQSVQPVLIIGVGSVVGAVAIGIPVAVGIWLAILWDRRRRANQWVYADATGRFPVASYRLERGDLDALAAATHAGALMADVERAKLPPPPGDVRVYSPRFITNERGQQERMMPSATIEAHGAPLALPGPLDLVNALTFKPSLDAILLGLGPGGQALTVPARRLVHVGVAGSTGQGKSVLIRLLMAQLAATGDVDLVLADPHYASVDPDSGEDWRPIERRLFMPPATSVGDIGHVLHDLAERELKLRLELRHDGVSPGRPRFLVIDELPVITGKIEDASDWLATLLREGRKVGLFCICGTQDMLVKTLGTGSGVRDCFRTGAYLGGDATTARVLLDVKSKDIPEAELGRGVMMLRSAATAAPTLARIPYASNEALYKLLPAPADQVSQPRQMRPITNFVRDEPATPQRPPLTLLRGGESASDRTGETAPTEDIEAETMTERDITGDFTAIITTNSTADARPTDPDEARRQRIRDLAEQGVSRNSICAIVFGSKGKSYMDYIRDAIDGPATGTEGD